MKKILIILGVILLIVTFINKGPLLNKQEENQSNQTEKKKKQIIHKRDSYPIVTKATLGAIGDILAHNEVYEDAEESNGSYNFHKMFNEVRGRMQKSDILVANQETMIGGKDLGLSTYPSFNSPYEVGDALKSAGVDIVTLANNHALDRGEKIIRSALSHWDQIHMPYTGVFKSQSDHDKIRTLTKNDIRFSFLAYTYGTNGIAIPTGKNYLVNLIDINQIRKDVQRAKAVSDVVVVSMHWGNESERFPNKEQKNLAKELADMGVQIVIGHHPHVLQPPAWITNKNGNKTYVFYSLGNFLSAQDEIYELIGGIASIEVVKTKTKTSQKIELTNPSFMPTYNYYRNNKDFMIIPLQSINEEFLLYGSGRYKEIKKHMRTYINDLYFEAP